MHLTGAPCSGGEEGLQLGVTHFPFLKLHCGLLDFQQEGGCGCISLFLKLFFHSELFLIADAIEARFWL